MTDFFLCLSVSLSTCLSPRYLSVSVSAGVSLLPVCRLLRLWYLSVGVSARLSVCLLPVCLRVRMRLYVDDSLVKAGDGGRAAGNGPSVSAATSGSFYLGGTPDQSTGNLTGCISNLFIKRYRLLSFHCLTWCHMVSSSVHWPGLESTGQAWSQLVRPGVNWSGLVPLVLPGVTWFQLVSHLVSPGVTLSCLASPGHTLCHLVSHLVFLVPPGLPGLTWCHLVFLVSPGVQWSGLLSPGLA